MAMRERREGRRDGASRVLTIEVAGLGGIFTVMRVMNHRGTIGTHRSGRQLPGMLMFVSKIEYTAEDGRSHDRH